MNALVQFIMKLLGLGDQSTIEKLIKSVLFGGKSADGSAGSNPLEDLMAQFKDKGLGDIFSSWVGTGKNAPISPDQVKEGVGEDRMTELARKAGLPVDDLAGKLAKYLPGLIDKMTPGGKLPGA